MTINVDYNDPKFQPRVHLQRLSAQEILNATGWSEDSKQEISRFQPRIQIQRVPAQEMHNQTGWPEANKEVDQNPKFQPRVQLQRLSAEEIHNNQSRQSEVIKQEIGASVEQNPKFQPKVQLQRLSPQEIHNKTGWSEASKQTFGASVEQNSNKSLCIICFSPRDKFYALIPCGHTSLCQPCCYNLTEHKSNSKCPSCRKPITSYMQIFYQEHETS